MLQKFNTVAKVGLEALNMRKPMKSVRLRPPRNFKSCCFIKFLHTLHLHYWLRSKNLGVRKRFGAQQGW